MLSSQGPRARGGGRQGAERRQSQRVSASSRPRGFEFIRQDEFPQFGSSRVSLGGDVHVRGVRSQQPGTLQAEGDTLSAAVNLQDNTQGLKAQGTAQDKEDTYLQPVGRNDPRSPC